MTRVRNALADLRQPRGEIDLRIKVTGFINSDSLGENYLDPNHETGLNNDGWEMLTLGLQEIVTIDDLEFKQVP